MQQCSFDRRIGRKPRRQAFQGSMTRLGVPEATFGRAGRQLAANSQCCVRSIIPTTEAVEFGRGAWARSSTAIDNV